MLRCPTEIKDFLPVILRSVRKYIEYDPNYAYDEYVGWYCWGGVPLGHLPPCLGLLFECALAPRPSAPRGPPLLPPSAVDEEEYSDYDEDYGGGAGGDDSDFNWKVGRGRWGDENE